MRGKHAWEDSRPGERAGPPYLVTNPASDTGFRAAAERAVARGELTPQLLERTLRETYARAVVRTRELSDESRRVWYVYREGHWVLPTHDQGRL